MELHQEKSFHEIYGEIRIIISSGELTFHRVAYAGKQKVRFHYLVELCQVKLLSFGTSCRIDFKICISRDSELAL